MYFIDTHTHIFLEQFKNDRERTINAAVEKGVNKFILPNIDSRTIDDVISLCNQYPQNCLPVMGLHPTSVKDNYEEEIAIIDEWLNKDKFYGIGETGIDLYWDKKYLKQQIIAFEHQIEKAKELNLPIIIHVRESFEEVFDIVDRLNSEKLRGVFHCFSGNKKQAEKIISYGGFKLGIGGVITFKNSDLANIISEIPLEHLVLETDSPYLAPVPYRGKRNESAFITYIAEKIAIAKNTDIKEVAKATTQNAKTLFGI